MVALTEDILHQVKPKLAAVFGDRLKAVVLYGSRARGLAREDSDVDLLVVLAEPVHLGEDLNTIISALYPLQLAVDVPLEALPVSAEAFNGERFGLYRHAKREGVFL
jgi:predicted nucleotidyltransferase